MKVPSLRRKKLKARPGFTTLTNTLCPAVVRTQCSATTIDGSMDFFLFYYCKKNTHTNNLTPALSTC